MSLLIKLVLGATGEHTLRQFRAECQHPRETQERLLLHYLHRNAKSAYGRAHDFARLRTVADYQRAVPIATYEDHAPYIEAALNGEPAQLTLDDPILFATTSGTTGKPKYIPITRESRTAKSRLMRIWLSALYHDFPAVFDGRIMAVVSPEVEEHAPCGTPCGAESGHGYRNMPTALRQLYSAPYELFEIKDYEAKYYALLRISAALPVRLIYTCNPSTVLLLAQRLGQFGPQLIEDIRRGGIGDHHPLPPETRRALEPYLHADHRRADQLEAALELGGGTLLPRHVWPDMPVIACWKGGSVGTYLSRFGEFFAAGLPVRDIGYFATELRGSIPMTDTGADGVLAVSTNFTEFFPAGEDRKPAGTELLTADQLEAGRQYYVYPSTHAGLCRYEMNDIIEVTGFHERTPTIRFIQKGKGVVSFTGEKLYEAQVIDAVAKAFEGWPGRHEFIVALGEMHGDRPRYAFKIEFDSPPSRDHGTALLQAIEQQLRTRNVEYAGKRDSRRIGPPVMQAVPLGEYQHFRKRQVAKGVKDGQFKTLRLTIDASFAAEFPATTEFTLDA